MHDVNKQALYNQTERFLLQYQRRNVIDSDSESTRENQRFSEHTDWKNLLYQHGRQELQEKIYKELKEMQGKDCTL